MSRHAANANGGVPTLTAKIGETAPFHCRHSVQNMAMKCGGTKGVGLGMAASCTHRRIELMSPRDHAELALGILHYCTDSSRHETHRLHLAADYLRDAGLLDMADTVTEAAGRACGDDSDVRAVCGRLWALLDAWPATDRRAA